MNDSATSQAQTFRWPVRVYYEDTDSGGLVYHTSYLRFMERARTEWLRRLGLGQHGLAQELGVLFAVRSVRVDYVKPAILDDELAVDTRVTRYRRTALGFDQRISRMDGSGSVLCRATVEVVCVDARSHRPRPIPETIITEIAHVG